MSKVYLIGRPIDGISINGLEYLMDDDNKVMEFDSKESITSFITDSLGVEDPEDIEELIWEAESELE